MSEIGNQSRNQYRAEDAFVPALLSILIFVIAQYNFLMFHTLAEIFAIIVAILILVVSWYMFPFTRNAFLMYLGCGYFWVGVLDLLHTLHYRGMPTAIDASGNVSTQFWVGTRYFEALLLLSAPWFLSRGIKRGRIFIMFGLIATLLVLSIKFGYFPVSYIDGQGLTSFKVSSEYIIILLLILALAHLWSRRHLIDRRIINAIMYSAIFTMFAELSFTFYVDVYDLSNVFGHIFKLVSYWLIFLATVRTTLQEPFIALARSANSYDAVPDAAVVVDVHGTIHEANSSAAKLHDCDKSALIGKDVHVLFHPDQIAKDVCPLCRAVAKSVQIDNYELKVDQLNKWFDISISHFHGMSGLTGSVEVLHDITKRKESEKKLDELRLLKDSIVENLPLMLFVKEGKNLNYVEWNKKAEELTGVDKASMIGHNDYEFWNREEAEFFIHSDREVLESQRLLDIPEETITTLKGDYLLHTRKIPILNERGESSYLLGISEDISGRREAELALRQSQKMDAMGNLSSGIAHDYNNMLSVMSGYAELLADQFADNDQAMNYIREILHATERGKRLTRKLLDFSRKRAHKETSVDVNKLIRDEQNMLEKTLTVKISLNLKLQEGLWTVWVDPHDLVECLINLVINAMHAMEGAGNLTVVTKNIRLSEENTLELMSGEYILLSVRDSGCGIPKEEQDKIFEPFYSTKGEAGTGLGLSQVYGFMLRSHGAIQVDSTVNSGTSFELYFPRHTTNGAESISFDSTDIDEYGGSQSILVVDDEPSIARLLDMFLSKAGYRTYVAHSGKQALALLKENPVDLVISDVLMPDIDGYQLACEIIRAYPQISVQLISGYSENANKKLVDEKYYNNILYKPLDRRTLLKRVYEILNSPSVE